jgi:hypothetical protein
MPPHKDDWIGVDLDRTLAVRKSGDRLDMIGSPIPEMVSRVKTWLAKDRNVKIFTARVNPIHADWRDQERLIHVWCLSIFGVVLPVTCMKDHRMLELWDDLAVSVEENTGRQMSEAWYGDDTWRQNIFDDLREDQRAEIIRNYLTRLTNTQRHDIIRSIFCIRCGELISSDLCDCRSEE